MPTPKQWSGPEDLIAELRRYDWRGWFEAGRTSHAQTDWQAIIKGAVGANTFRAFTRLPNRPSVVFREWAYKSLADGTGHYAGLMAVNSQTEYDEWLNEFAGSFRRRWTREMGREIPCGPSLKLPNLLMKTVCLCPEVPKSKARRLIWYLHVPLDSYTIQAVRNCMDLSGLAARIGRIPTSAGMGFVDGIEVYRAFQDVLRTLAAKAKTPPITLDLVAWDAAH